MFLLERFVILSSPPRMGASGGHCLGMWMACYEGQNRRKAAAAGELGRLVTGLQAAR